MSNAFYFLKDVSKLKQVGAPHGVFRKEISDKIVCSRDCVKVVLKKYVYRNYLFLEGWGSKVKKKEMMLHEPDKSKCYINLINPTKAT